MGMMDWVNDEDDEETSDADGDDEDTDEFDDLDDFDDDFDDDLDGFDDDFDDDFDDSLDAEDDDGFDDEFGGFDDDDFDDEFGERGSSGGDGVDERLAEFEDRIGELETEVGSISSTMNTVREENKQIGETVDELDDTIRKLLDIYEMVTRGINPFVDDAREMGGLEHGDGAFGLFDSEEEDDEDLDPEVANADAESFFDEDFGELDAEAGEERAEQAAEDELAEAEPEEPEMLDDPAPQPDPDGAEPTGESSGGGVSFDDLKAEYEEGDGWDDDAEADATDDSDERDAAVDDSDEDGVESDVDEASETGDEEADAEVDGEVPVDGETDDVDADEHAESDVDGEDDADDENDENDVDGVVDDADGENAESDVDGEDDVTVTSDAEPRSERVTLPSAEDPDSDDAEDAVVGPADGATPAVGAAEAVTDDEMFLGGDAEGDRGIDAGGSETDEPIGRERRGARRATESNAHLSTLPPTYVAESVAMEWVRYLVSVGGPLGASRALRQYQDFGWISEDVRRTLETYVRLTASPQDDGGNAPLGVEHHETSLSYVSRLGDDDAGAAALEALVADGGGYRGIRR